MSLNYSNGSKIFDDFEKSLSEFCQNNSFLTYNNSSEKENKSKKEKNIKKSNVINIIPMVVSIMNGNNKKITILHSIVAINEVEGDYNGEELNKNYDINCGGYYYALTNKSSEYSKISGLIQLPDSIQTNSGKRNAYIVFGINGKISKINIGLINNGTGWRPFMKQ